MKFLIALYIPRTARGFAHARYQLAHSQCTTSLIAMCKFASRLYEALKEELHCSKLWFCHEDKTTFISTPVS